MAGAGCMCHLLMAVLVMLCLLFVKGQSLTEQANQREIMGDQHSTRGLKQLQNSDVPPMLSPERFNDFVAQFPPNKKQRHLRYCQMLLRNYSATEMSGATGMQPCTSLIPFHNGWSGLHHSRAWDMRFARAL